MRVELRTPRLLLRPFRSDDVAAAQAYRDDPEFAHFLPHVPVPFTRADAEAFVRRNMAEPWDTSPTFAVTLDGGLIGTVNLDVDAGDRAAMLGYAIGRAWWGRGLATEAARAVLRYGVDTFALARVWASTDVRHVASQRVMAKLGMSRGAVHAGHHAGRGGEPVDEVVYGMAVVRRASGRSAPAQLAVGDPPGPPTDVPPRRPA